MTPGDWAAVAVAIAALIVACGALPQTPHRRSVIGIAGLLVVVAIMIGVLDNTGVFSVGRGEPGAGNSNAAPPSASVTPAPQQMPTEDYAEVPLTTGGSTSATLYFGKLASVVQRISAKSPLSVSDSLIARRLNSCVETVVFDGVQAGGRVYGTGLGDGWAGAEDSPDQTGSGGKLHQQLVFPPQSATDQSSWTVSGRLVADDGSTTTTSTVRITLESRSGEVWSVLPGSDVGIACSLT